MRSKLVIGKNRIHPWDWLLIIGIVMAPMTGLRVWKAGPAEVLCLLWTLRYFPRRFLPVNDTLKFFAGFLGTMLVGALVGSVAAPQELRPAGYLVWVYLAYIALAMYEGLRHNEAEYNEMLLRRIAALSVLWYLFLFVFSITISRSFFGAPLWFSNSRYSGGGTNPHQVAVLMCAVTFVLVRAAQQRHHSLFNLLLAAGAVFIIAEAQSSTGYIAIALGALQEIYFFGSRYTNSKRRKAALLFGEMTFACAFAFAFRVRISRMLYAWISSDHNGYGRLVIFSSFWDCFRKSPLVGLGPGVHALDGVIEFHNTYLEILAATGVIGFAAFVLYTVRILKKMRYDYSLLPIIVALYAYGLAGFAMRRLAYWGITAFVLVIAEGKRESSVEGAAEQGEGAALRTGG